MATLADINNTLLTTQKVSIESGNKIDALAQMWADYTFDYRQKMNDEALQRLETERESKRMQAMAKTASNDSRQSGGSSGGFLDGLGMGGLAGLGSKGALGLATTFLKRGALGAAAVLFADEIAAAIPGLAGNPELRGGVEAALVGGGAGFALGGVKGGLAGAVVGAGFQLSDMVGQVLGEQAAKLDLNSITIAEQGGKSATQALSLAVAGAMVGGPVGGLIGGIAGLGLEGARLYGEYKNNPEFRSEVDGAIASTGKAVAQIFEDVQNAANNIPGLDTLITTDQERQAALDMMAQIYPNLAATADKQEQIMRDYNAVGNDIARVNEKYNLGLGANATNVDLRQAMKAKGVDVDTAALFQETYRSALNAADLQEFKDQIGYVARTTSEAAVDGYNKTVEALTNQENRLAANLAGERSTLSQMRDPNLGFGTEAIAAQEQKIADLSAQLNQLRTERGAQPIVVNAPQTSNVSTNQAALFQTKPDSTHRSFFSQ